MRTRIFAVSVAVTLSIVAARPAAQSSGLDRLIQKAKEKLTKPKIVECAANDQVCIDNARKAGAAVKLTDPPAPPSPSQTAAAPGQTPASSAAGSSTGLASGTGFDAPEPDHLSLFKLFMAANADVLGTDKGVAWEHYLLFSIPPGTAANIGNTSRECMALQTKVRNEITGASLLAEAQAGFRQALVAAQSAPKTAVFRLRTREHFGPYDTTKNAFPLDTINSGYRGATATFPIARDTRGSSVPSSYRGPAQSFCVGGPPGSAASLAPTVWNHYGAFALEVQGHEGLTGFPMDRAAAESYVNIHPERVVDLDVVIEVGPALMRSANYGMPVPARIIAARLLGVPDGRVLHTFSMAGARPTATNARQAPSDAVLFTSNSAFLLTARDHPARVTDDVVIQATRNQVGAEQMMWRQVDLIRDRPPNQVRWNPKRSIFAYEWQTLIERQPDVARGPLLDLFLRPDPDWSLVTRDPAWDTRFDALVVATLFARDKVDGRDPSFAAQELAPVYKQHLALAASKAPTKFWIPMSLPPYTYDFAAQAIRFATRLTAGKPSAIGGTDVVHLANDDAPSLMQYVVPPAARGLATYPLSGFLATMQRAEPESTNPGLKANVRDGIQAWRHAFAIGSSARAMPLVEVLALDRSLQLTSLPMEPSRAEALAKRKASNPSSGLTARVYFDADHVEVGERIFDQRSPSGVLLAKVQKIEVLDPDNVVIATIAASALPAPAIAPPAPSSPTPPQPPTAAAPRRPTAAETEAEVQRRNAENSAKVSEALNRATAEQIKQAMAAAEKDQKCRADAGKVNKDPQSKAYQDAYAACRAAK
jgi:hypothetical protein